MILKPIILSLKIASISTVITLIIGVFLGRVLTRYDFKGKNVLEVLLVLPMVLPPSVTGYGLLILLGRNGIIGRFFYDWFGISFLFDWKSAILAATIVSLPLMFQSCKTAFLSVNPVLENAARTLGANERDVFWKVAFPIAWPSIISGIVLSFSRAIGEFGATLMVAGNIPGKTQTIPIAIYFASDAGDYATANTLVLIVISFSFCVIYGLNHFMKKREF